MGATVIQAIAQRLQSADPANAQAQREVFESIRDLRTGFEGPLDPESQRCLEAASMLVAYLARMGSLAGDDVRSIAVRLLERAAELENAPASAAVPVAASAHAAPAAPAPAPVPAAEAAPAPAAPHRPAVHVIRAGDTANAAVAADEKAPEAVVSEQSASDLMGDMMLGQILLRRGQILEEHIHQAMKVQRATGLRIGDVLVKIGAATRAQLDDALGYQASCRRVRENLGTEQQTHAAVKPVDTRGTGLKLMGEVLLGEVLIERGVITRRQLERALDAQKQSGLRIGEALVKIGAATIEHIEHALRVQGHDRKFSVKPSGQAPPQNERERKRA